MSLTYIEAKNAALDPFQALNPAIGIPIRYENVPYDGDTFPPKDATAYGWVIFRHSGGGQETLGGGPDGAALYQRTALLQFDIYTEAGKGTSEGFALCQRIANLYESESPGNTMRFINVRLVDLGLTGSWYRQQVLVDVVYSQRV